MQRLCNTVLAGLTVLGAPAANAGISDNSFFVEEAYNQEAGVVQHVQTLQWVREREGGSTARWFLYAFTQEWPLGGVRSQLSYTIPYIRAFGDQPGASGIGDAQVHYRFQAVEESGTRPAFAPRLTVYLPLGDARKGLGADAPGLEVNLPLSKRIRSFHFHLNAGATTFLGSRGTRESGEPTDRHNIFGTNLAASAILLLEERFNLLLEFSTREEQSVGEEGGIEGAVRTVLSPGIRYAIDRRDGGQWVFGLATPLGLSDRANDFGALFYLSFEHPF